MKSLTYCRLAVNHSYTKDILTIFTGLVRANKLAIFAA